MPPVTELILMIATLVVTGAFAGILAGLLGVGGGIVLVPAFFYVFTHLGYVSNDLMQLCLATSLATIIVTSARSVMAHNRKGAVDWDILKSWVPGLTIGALIGVVVVRMLDTHTLQVVFGVLVLMIATYMGLGKSSWRLAEEMPGGWRRAVYSTTTGILAVLLGIGGGSIGVPLQTLHGRPIHRAVATTAGFGIVIAVPSALVFLFMPIDNPPPLTVGSINLPAFLIVICVSTLTAPFGATLAHKTDAARLKRIFAIFLGAVALNMLRKALF